MDSNGGSTSRRDYDAIERRYWNLVDNQVGELRQVEYAADIPTSVFGSAFGKKGQKLLSKDQQAYESHMWNLNNFPNLPNSLM